MEHLALEIFDLDGKGGSKYANLPEDASITITDTSEIFASGDVWSHSFTLNTHANAHIFGTSGEIHGSRLHEQINKRRARLWVEGLPLYLGYLKLGDEVEVDENGDVSVSFESGQKTFEDMIEGAKANQVPMMGDVRFGVALWRKRFTRTGFRLMATIDYTTEKGEQDREDLRINGHSSLIFEADGENDPVQEYPRMVFPKGNFKDLSNNKTIPIDCLNTDYAYDDSHPYCNVALCYQRYGYEKKMEDGSYKPQYDSEPEAQRGYETMPANRVNSAPNFFVIYWIKALMKHLGINIEENQMMDVEDLRRLFFVNTNCAYKEPKVIRGTNYDKGYGRYKFSDSGRLIAERWGENVITKNSKFTCTNYHVNSSKSMDGHTLGDDAIKGISISLTKIDMDANERKRYEDENSYLHDAYATSECFPDANISDVIDALVNGFGIRLLFDRTFKRVRIILIRNIFQNPISQEIDGEVISRQKIENHIRGFRMTYGNSDDTAFYYKGFADKLPHKKPYFADDTDKHDYSNWDLDSNYTSIIKNVSAFDKTCYVTANNGNAYGIKVDKDAKRYDELHPATFEFAGYMDAEDGDCTGDEETIKTVNVGFLPAIMNDVNFENERSGSTKQQFALFVDAKMRPRRPDLKDGKDYNKSDAVYNVDNLYNSGSFNSMKGKDGLIMPGLFHLGSDLFFKLPTITIDYEHFEGAAIYYTNLSLDVEGYVNEGYALYLQDNYEPNDEGYSPIEKKKWGLTLGIMRGSGSDAYVNYTSDPDDGEENDTWDIVAGSSVTAHPDTCDNYGNEWDYNGEEVVTKSNAQAKLYELFPHSNAYFNVVGRGYVINATRRNVTDGNGIKHSVLMAYRYSEEQAHPSYYTTYTKWLTKKLKESTTGGGIEEVYSLDLGGNGTLSNVVIEVDTTYERSQTMLHLCGLAYGTGWPDIKIDNGVGSRYGRFSLKLRAEKLNPYYVKDSTEEGKSNQYLTIDNENLRGRGLADQFYKEYSYWIRNARIVKCTVRMELAQLLTIDKTERVTVGDVTGFIRKIQYSISNKTGLGTVTLEIMYI